MKIKAILEENNFAVLSTNSSTGFPESALVGFSSTEDLDIVFRSLNPSRKNQNIKKDSKVSMVIGFGESGWSLQIEGVANILTKEDSTLLRERHCQKLPVYKKFEDNDQNEYFMIKPLWFRYSDLSVNPVEVWEVV